VTREDKVDAMPSSLHCIVDAAVDPGGVVVRDGGGGRKEGGLMLPVFRVMAL
jgi:hypothetical protein